MGGRVVATKLVVLAIIVLLLSAPPSAGAQTFRGTILGTGLDKSKADASLNGIDRVTGRGIGFMPLTVTPDVGLGNPFLGGGGPRNIQMALKLLF